MIKVLEFGEEGSYALSDYLASVYDRIGERDYALLMEDAEIVLTYEKISPCIYYMRLVPLRKTGMLKMRITCFVKQMSILKGEAQW